MHDKHTFFIASDPVDHEDFFCLLIEHINFDQVSKLENKNISCKFIFNMSFETFAFFL